MMVEGVLRRPPCRARLDSLGARRLPLDDDHPSSQLLMNSARFPPDEPASAREQLILDALASRDLVALRALAARPGGLLSDNLRRRVWCVMASFAMALLGMAVLS